jgi:hypothetical protein
MAQDYAASVLGAAIRVSRLNADGSLAGGASGSYVQTAFIRVSMTPEYEAGDEINQKGANGITCVTFKAPDSLKRVNLEVSICNPDPEFEEMIAGGLILAEGGKSVGYAAPLVGEDANPNGVALEVWSQAIAGGKRASTNPYWHWVVPYASLRPSGDRVVENGLMANVYSGFGLGNASFGEGPTGDWPFISDRPYQYARTATAPVGLQGYQAVTVNP